MALKPSKKAKAERERAESIERQREDTGEQSKAVRFEFIISELELALTFCRVAASTHIPARSTANIIHAQEAYRTASRFLASSRLSEPMRSAVQSRISDLKSLLRDLQNKHD
jgi:hypothetical protein